MRHVLAVAAALHACFGASQYHPGQVARLHVLGSRPAQLQVFRVGALSGGGPAPLGRDRTTDGIAVTPPRAVRGPVVWVPVGPAWPTGVYAARLVGPRGGVAYAPFVVTSGFVHAPILVVEPTRTWQAYDFWQGDSWYEHPAVHRIDLRRPFPGDGLPRHFGVDLGFLRWVGERGAQADFVSDDGLDAFPSARALRRRYRLIVFPGHEEYVTPHVYSLIQGYRDLGGNLAFLSANDFFYRVAVRGRTMLGRTRWRDLGRPAAALLGVEYDGWQELRYGNGPYTVVGAQRARWLFAGTGLHDGSRFGAFGIEIDTVTSASPRDVRVLARMVDPFGPGTRAEMTIYRRGAATVFAAGVLNFGASAAWEPVGTLLDNLWTRLGGVTLTPPG